MAAFFGVDYNLSISWRIKDNGSDVVVAHTHTHTADQTDRYTKAAAAAAAAATPAAAATATLAATANQPNHPPKLKAANWAEPTLLGLAAHIHPHMTGCVEPAPLRQGVATQRLPVCVCVCVCAGVRAWDCAPGSPARICAIWRRNEINCYAAVPQIGRNPVSQLKHIIIIIFSHLPCLVPNAAYTRFVCVLALKSQTADGQAAATAAD